MVHKNPHYQRRTGKPKTTKQILTLDAATAGGGYAGIVAPPSLRPQKKYCDITGLPAPYTDPISQLHYANIEVYKEIKTLQPGEIQAILTIRGAGSIIK